MHVVRKRDNRNVTRETNIYSADSKGGRILLFGGREKIGKKKELVVGRKEGNVLFAGEELSYPFGGAKAYVYGTPKKLSAQRKGSIRSFGEDNLA